MRFRVLISALITCFSSSSAMADSFCNFDQGLVGTKAIGFVAPYKLNTIKYEAGECELEGFDAASNEALSTVLNCTDFQHLPSPYMDNYEGEGLNPLESDYFYLQVIDAKENWAQLLLKSGDKKWVKKKIREISIFLISLKRMKLLPQSLQAPPHKRLFIQSRV